MLSGFGQFMGKTDEKSGKTFFQTIYDTLDAEEKNTYISYLKKLDSAYNFGLKPLIIKAELDPEIERYLFPKSNKNEQEELPDFIENEDRISSVITYR